MWILIFDGIACVICTIAIIYAMIDDDRKRWKALHPKLSTHKVKSNAR